MRVVNCVYKTEIFNFIVIYKNVLDKSKISNKNKGILYLINLSFLILFVNADYKSKFIIWSSFKIINWILILEKNLFNIDNTSL